MAKDFYFIGLKIQKPMRCRVLAEKNPSGRTGMNHYLLEFYDPIPRSTYYKFPLPEDSKMISKMRFSPYAGDMFEPYAKTGPFWGSVGFYSDPAKASIDYFVGGEDRSVLCISEKQAQEFLQNLEALKKKRYYLDFFGTRSAEVIKDLTFGGCEGYWLLKISPPVRGHYFGRVKDISYLVFWIKDFPMPPDFGTLGGGASPFHEDAVIKVIEDSFTEEDYQWAFIKGGHYSDECVLLPSPRPEWPQPDSLEVEHDRAAAYYAQQCRNYLLTKKGSHPPIPIKLQLYLTDKKYLDDPGHGAPAKKSKSIEQARQEVEKFFEEKRYRAYVLDTPIPKETYDCPHDITQVIVFLKKVSLVQGEPVELDIYRLPKIVDETTLAALQLQPINTKELTFLDTGLCYYATPDEAQNLLASLRK